MERKDGGSLIAEVAPVGEAKFYVQLLSVPALRAYSTDLILSSTKMDILAQTALPLAAAGYSLVYLLVGGGFFGALVIFMIMKMAGK